MEFSSLSNPLKGFPSRIITGYSTKSPVQTTFLIRFDTYPFILKVSYGEYQWDLILLKFIIFKRGFWVDFAWQFKWGRE